MSCATAAKMSLQHARPCLARARFVRPHPGFIVRVQPRFFHERCRAKGPDDVQNSGPDREQTTDRSVAHRRRQDLMPPDVPFRRMSDYMDNLHRDMESMMDVFGVRPGFFGRSSPFGLAERGFDFPSLANLRSIALDIDEDEKEYRIKAAVPGFSKDNIKITLTDDGVLSIEGHESVDIKEEEGAAKRTSKDFVRRVQLPDHVNREGIAAHVEHGVLSLTLPKVEKPEVPAPKEIPIN